MIKKKMIKKKMIKKKMIRTLESWAKQGVLLLNTSLTVLENNPGSHSRFGWVIFTNNAIKYLEKYSKDNNIKIIYCLWGRHAQGKKELIKNGIVLESSHPSPLGATKTKTPFIGSNHFSKINDILFKNGDNPIIWYPVDPVDPVDQIGPEIC